MDSETWHAVLAANLTGVFHCLRAELRHLTAGAAVVNVASIAGIVGFETNGAVSSNRCSLRLTPFTMNTPRHVLGFRRPGLGVPAQWPRKHLLLGIADPGSW